MNKVLFIMVIVVGLLAGGLKAQAAYTPMAGDLIKISKSSAVYIIDDNLRRHLFPNEVTYWTWHTGSWSDQKIKVITQDEFDELQLDKNVIARPGANLITFDNSNKIYAVTPGGVLCETRALYGDNWQSRVIKIQSSFEADYIKDNSCLIISTSKLPDGSLIQYQGSKDIYYIDNGKKRKVTTEGFKANNFKDSSVIKNVSAAMVYTSNSKSISAFDYNLGVLYALTYSRSQEITSRPDFMITDIIFPTDRISVNQTVEIKLLIRNLGGNLTSDTGLRRVVFTAPDWETQNVSHASYPTVSSPLQTGQTFEITYSGRFVGSGSKEFIAKVDEPSEVVEINERNNIYTEKITVYSN